MNDPWQFRGRKWPSGSAFAGAIALGGRNCSRSARNPMQSREAAGHRCADDAGCDRGFMGKSCSVAMRLLLDAIAFGMSKLAQAPHAIVFLAFLLGMMSAPGVGYSQETDDSTSVPPIDLADYLTGPVDRGESPGLVAAVIDEHGVKAIGAAGLRRQGSRSPITVNDLVHIGSNTKAMTATMLATLVADGTFERGWKTTIGDVFPKLAKTIHPDYRSVTLSEMVRLEGGIA